jgi:hypothetical protein
VIWWYQFSTSLKNGAKRPLDARGMIRAVLMILVSTVAVVGFLYLALALSDHH